MESAQLAIGHRHLDTQLHVLWKGLNRLQLVERFVDAVDPGAKKLLCLPHDQPVKINDRSAIRLGPRDDRHLKQNAVREKSLDRTLGRIVPRRTNVEIRLNEGELLVVQPPITVNLARLQTRVTFAAGHRQSNKMLLVGKIFGKLGQ